MRVSYPMHLPPCWAAGRPVHRRDWSLLGPLRLHQEHQSAGYVVGADPVPVEVLAVRVGGPLSTLRAEAAGSLQLLTRLSEK
jgi:hypothetical protein